MDLRTSCTLNYVCISLLVLCVSSANEGFKARVIGVGEDEVVPMGSADIIMKEDAQEIFYNVDFDKYEGMKCPVPKAPENGEIIGEGMEVGSVVYVQCKEGFYLSGPTVMACSPVDGTVRWDPDVDRSCNKGETYFKETDEIEEKHKGQENENGVFSNLRHEIPIGFDDEDSQDFQDDSSPPPPMPIMDMQSAQEEESARRDQEDDEELKDMWTRGDYRWRMELESILPSECLLKPDKGPCDSSFLRYHFEKSTMECASFFYGGCEGNGNNFESITECNHACLRKLP